MSPSPAISLRGVDHDDPLAEVVGEDAGDLAQHRRLADARPAEDEERLPGLDDVADDVDGAEHRAADAAGEADDLAGAVADRADAVERPLDAGAVVVAEDADVVDDVRDIGLGDLPVEQVLLAGREPRLRPAAEVHHDLEQVGPVGEPSQAITDLGRECLHQGIEVVGRLAACHVSSRLPFARHLIAGTITGSRTCARTSRTSSVTRPIGSKPESCAARVPADSYVRTGARIPAAIASLPMRASTARRNRTPSTPSRTRKRR